MLKLQFFAANPGKLEPGLGGLVLGSLFLILNGMRIIMFQLSGFYYNIRFIVRVLGYGG